MSERPNQLRGEEKEFEWKDDESPDMKSVMTTRSDVHGTLPDHAVVSGEDLDKVSHYGEGSAVDGELRYGNKPNVDVTPGEGLEHVTHFTSEESDGRTADMARSAFDEVLDGLIKATTSKAVKGREEWWKREITIRSEKKIVDIMKEIQNSPAEKNTVKLNTPDGKGISISEAAKLKIIDVVRQTIREINTPADTQIVTPKTGREAA